MTNNDKIEAKEVELEMQRKELARLSEILLPLRKSINQLEADIGMETMKKYVGKYFIYKNSGGGSKNWNVYVKPIKVVNGWQVTVLTAQKSHYLTEIKLEESSGDHLFQNEISKEVFDKGFNEILKDINEANEQKSK